MLKAICIFGGIWLTGMTGRADDVDDFIRKTMAERHLPGLSLAVTRDGRMLKQAAYGQVDVESKAPLTVSTALPILSATKSFTAVAVMMLVEDGKLRLDDRISLYLTNLPTQWEPVTIRQCLTHTAGIRSFEALPGYFRRIEPTHPTEADLLKLMETLPLDFTPGDRWSYCNTGYLLLGMLIETISGRPYAEFVAERIFKPATLGSTRVLEGDTPAGGRRQGYTWRDGRIVKVPAFDLGLVKSIGSIESTAGDLAEWMEAVAAGGLLRPASLELMWSPAKLKAGSEVKSYGLGWWISDYRGHPVVSAIGGPALGFFACISYLPADRLSVVCLANSDAAGAAGQKIVRDIAGLYLGK